MEAAGVEGDGEPTSDEDDDDDEVAGTGADEDLILLGNTGMLRLLNRGVNDSCCWGC